MNLREEAGRLLRIGMMVVWMMCGRRFIQGIYLEEINSEFADFHYGSLYYGEK